MTDEYLDEDALPRVAWRRVNEDYEEPRQDDVRRVLVVLPNSRWQRALHRLHLCRWHRHEVRGG